MKLGSLVHKILRVSSGDSRESNQEWCPSKRRTPGAGRAVGRSQAKSRLGGGPPLAACASVASRDCPLLMPSSDSYDIEGVRNRPCDTANMHQVSALYTILNWALEAREEEEKQSERGRCHQKIKNRSMAILLR